MSLLLRRTDKIIARQGKIIVGADILVNDGIISAVGLDLPVPRDSLVIDCSGLCAVPGLIDTHCHVESAGGHHGVDKDLSPELKAIRAAVQVEKVVLTGTTSLADAGARGNVSFALRKAITKGITRGPRFFACGEMIRMTGGRTGAGPGEVDGADSARKAARIMIARGADFIKLGATGAVSNPGMRQRSPQLTLEEMTAACEEAHKAGLKVHAHAYGDEGINLSIKAGADVIVHGISLNEENTELMLRKELTLIPTLSTYKAKMGQLDELPSWQSEKMTEIWEELETNTRRVISAGIKIATGTDSGMVFNYFGRSSREMDLLVGWGMTPAQALHSATYEAARTLGLEDSLGTIEPGKLADVLLLRGDPSTELDVLSRKGGVALVIVGGAPVAAFDHTGIETKLPVQPT